jgi:hypothetical protein
MSLYDWSDFFEDAAPVGYLLREKYKHLWVRFYGLTGGKRYPDNSDEESNMIKNYCDIGRSVLDQKKNQIFIGLYPEEQTLDSFDWNWWKRIPKVKHFATYDDNALDVYRALFSWHESVFEEIVLDVIEENIPHVSFFNQVTGNTFCPYDGGMDIFIQKHDELNQLKKTFEYLLSDRPDGL